VVAVVFAMSASYADAPGGGEPDLEGLARFMASSRSVIPLEDSASIR
jgi:hypothetical protein